MNDVVCDIDFGFGISLCTNYMYVCLVFVCISECVCVFFFKAMIVCYIILRKEPNWQWSSGIEEALT